MLGSRHPSILSAVLAITIAPVFLFAQDVKPDTATSAVDESGLSYGFVVDNSGSFRLLLERVIEFVTAVAKENGRFDEAFFVRYIGVDKVTMEQDMTASKGELVDAAEAMYIEGGQAALIDAVKFSAKHLIESSRPGDGRIRALLVISDGDERGSVTKIEPTIQYLKENKVRIFAVGVSDEKVQTKALERLARETGGKLFVMKSSSLLPAAAGEVAASMRKP